MAEFKSFRDIGQAFQGGMQALGRPGASYVPAYRTIAAYEAALRHAGQRFVEHFERKFDERGPGWQPLAEATQLDRAYWGARAGIGSSYDHQLVFSEQLKNALRYEVDSSTAGGGSLQVGFENLLHEHPGGVERWITMEDLVITKELGTSTEPPRPIMFDADFNAVENSIVEEFSMRALFGNLVQRVRE